MDNNFTKELSIIVSTLLKVSELVVELSKEQIITNIWGSNQSSLYSRAMELVESKINRLPHDFILAQAATQIISSIEYGNDSYEEYELESNKKLLSFGIRALMIHPSQDHILVTVAAVKCKDKSEPVEDKWRLALDAAGDGVWDIHLKTNRIYFSPKWHELFGYTSGEINTVEHWTSKLHPDDYIVAEQNFRGYVNGESSIYSCELRYRCKDGSYKWILSRGVFIAQADDGEPLRFLGTHKDIHERKILEEEHRANLSLLLNLMNSMPSGILVTDQNRKLLFANKAFCKMYDIEQHPKELRGTDAHQSLQKDKLQYKHPDQLVARIEEILNDRHTVLDEELELGDGRTISRDYIPLSFKDDYRGEIWKFNDVTAKKKLTDTLHRQNSELEANTQMLLNKIGQLEDLSLMIAHNLRGPIGNMTLVSKRLMMDDNDPAIADEPFTREEANMVVYECVNLLSDSLNTLMEISQIKLNKEIARSDCNFQSLIGTIISQLQAVIYEKKAEIHVDLEVREFSYPKVYLESILYNLISNALKYSQPEKAPTILISTKITDGRVSLVVKDNGLGIDMEKFGHDIFKLNKVFHIGFDSKGVGLFLTRSQIESLGGTITVYSKPYEGCEFVIIF